MLCAENDTKRGAGMTRVILWDSCFVLRMTKYMGGG